MPSSIKDRFTVDYEIMIFAVKSKKYYFEQQYEPVKKESIKRAEYGHHTHPEAQYANNIQTEKMGKRFVNPELGRNKRTTWMIPTHSFSESHFAVFPEALCKTPIIAGCPDNGIVLDPFIGSGTTGLVAKKLGRNWIGIEMNPHYIQMATERINGFKRKDWEAKRENKPMINFAQKPSQKTLSKTC